MAKYNAVTRQIFSKRSFTRRVLRKVKKAVAKAFTRTIGRRIKKITRRVFAKPPVWHQTIYSAPAGIAVFHQALGKNFKAALANSMQKAGKQVVRLLRENTFVRDRGQFERGWTAMTNPAAPSTRVFNKAPHAMYVERGRRPGAKFPPVDKIRSWVQRNINPAADQLDSIAFLVGRAIHQRGIPARPVQTDPGMMKMSADLFYSYVIRKLEETVWRQAIARAMRAGRHR